MQHSRKRKGRASPILRAIRPGDAAALCAIANMPGFRRGTLRIPFETVEYWEQRINGSGPEDTWIAAEVDGKVVGHGCLMARNPARRAHIGELIMGVADDHVGRGVGSAILAALLDVADNWRGLKRVELMVRQRGKITATVSSPLHLSFQGDDQGGAKNTIHLFCHIALMPITSPPFVYTPNRVLRWKEDILRQGTRTENTMTS